MTKSSWQLRLYIGFNTSTSFLHFKFFHSQRNIRLLWTIPKVLSWKRNICDTYVHFLSHGLCWLLRLICARRTKSELLAFFFSTLLQQRCCVLGAHGHLQPHCELSQTHFSAFSQESFNGSIYRVKLKKLLSWLGFYHNEVTVCDKSYYD